MSECLAQSQEQGWKLTLEKERKGRRKGWMEEKVRCVPTTERRESRWGGRRRQMGANNNSCHEMVE